MFADRVIVIFTSNCGDYSVVSIINRHKIVKNAVILRFDNPRNGITDKEFDLIKTHLAYDIERYCTTPNRNGIQVNYYDNPLYQSPSGTIVIDTIEKIDGRYKGYLMIQLN